VLRDDRSVHLAGIHAPCATTPELAKSTALILNDHIAGHAVTVANAVGDLCGRLSGWVHVLADKGRDGTLQEIMLRQGLASIYPPTGFESGLASMTAAENTAR
jgi:hypothetical protein